jgi:hypothetical protein
MVDPNNPCHYCHAERTFATLPLPPKAKESVFKADRRLCHTCAHRKVEELFFVVFDHENEQTAGLRHLKLCDEKHVLLRGRRFGDTSALPSGRDSRGRRTRTLEELMPSQ